MAQENSRIECSISKAGVESTFNSAPSVSAIIPVSGSGRVRMTNNDVEVNRESPELYDADGFIPGLQTWELDFEHYLQVLAAQLTSGTLTTPQFLKILAGWFGGQSPAESGSVGGTTAASPGTATSVTLVSDAAVTVGELLQIPTANGMEVCRCTAKPGSNVLTLNPGLSTTPSANAAIASMVNLYPTPGVGSVSTAAFQIARNDSANLQWSLTGGIGAVSFTFEPGKALTISIRARGKSWSHGALSYTVAVPSDPMGSPVAWANNAKLLLQAVATATATHYSFESITIEYDLGLDFLPDGGGSNQGAAGVIRSSGRRFAKVTLKTRPDTQLITWYSAKTALQLMFTVPYGSGTSRQHIAWYIPRCEIDAHPTPDSSGGRDLYSTSLSSRIDTSASGLLKAPGILAVG